MSVAIEYPMQEEVDKKAYDDEFQMPVIEDGDVPEEIEEKEAGCGFSIICLTTCDSTT